MSKYVSVKTKYYKHSNAAGEMGHVDRLFAENVNSFSEYTKNNFGSDFDLLSRYNELNSKRVEVTGKNVRKDANTFFDAVVVFSLEQFEELERTHPAADLQEKLSLMMNDYMQKMKDEYRFEPIGFKFHLDEGHMQQYEAYQNQQERLKKGLVSDDEKMIEKDELVRNIHAHVLFYNFDFEKKISPWRGLKKKDFERFQDLAALSFEKLGFVRGVSKKETKKKGLNKDDHVKRKQAEQDRIIKENKKIIEQQDAVMKQKDDEILIKDKKIDHQNKVISALSEKVTKHKKILAKWMNSCINKAHSVAEKLSVRLAKDVSLLPEKEREEERKMFEDIENNIKARNSEKVSNKIVTSPKRD